MKKFWLYLIGVVLLIGAVLAIVWAVNGAKDDKTQSSNSSDLTASNSSKKACSIFTLGDAKQILGDGAKGGAGQADESSDDLAVSSCSYTRSSGPSAPVSSTSTASLLVRSPTTATGSQSNDEQFGTLRPSGVEDVRGYGKSAYWDAEHGQLNILKNNTWYIVSNGPIAVSDRTLDQAKQLADLLIDKM